MSKAKDPKPQPAPKPGKPSGPTPDGVDRPPQIRKAMKIAVGGAVLGALIGAAIGFATSAGSVRQ
jgi:hypothetical protein